MALVLDVPASPAARADVPSVPAPDALSPVAPAPPLEASPPPPSAAVVTPTSMASSSSPPAEAGQAARPPSSSNRPAAAPVAEPVQPPPVLSRSEPARHGTVLRPAPAARPRPEPRGASYESATPPPAQAERGGARAEDTQTASRPSLAAPAAPAAAVVVPAHPVAGLSTNRPPAYPAVAQRRGEEGRVMLRVAVSQSGTALSVSVLTSSGHEMLDAAATAAVREWRFVPATRDGVAIVANADVPVDFHMPR